MGSFDDYIYHAVFEGSRDAIFLIEEGRFVDCNLAAIELLEAIDEQAILGARLSDFAPARQAEGPSERMDGAHIERAEREGSAFFEWTCRTLAGRELPTEVRLSRIDAREGALIQAIVRDISGHQKIEKTLKESNRLLEHFRTLVVDAIDHSGIGVFILDRDMRVVWSSRSIQLFLGLEPESLAGRDMRGLIADSIATLLEDGARFVRNTEIVYRNGATLEGRVYHVLPADGIRERWLEHHSYPIESGIYTGGRVDMYRDLTDRVMLEHELAHRATHDYLTGLLSRRQFENLLENEIRRCRRYGSDLCLVMFDVDRFKRVNDSLGHESGDEVLTGIARTARDGLRDTDSLARWGGEEFMAMLPDCGLADGTAVAEKLRKRIRGAPFQRGLEGGVTVSLGVTRYRDGESLREMLQRVDDGLYQAKQQGRDRVVAVE